MGCAHRRPAAVPAKEELIQLLLADFLLEEAKRPMLTDHVLGVLQRNANTAGWPMPQTIEVSAVEVIHGNGHVCGNGEVVANVTYTATF